MELWTHDRIETLVNTFKNTAIRNYLAAQAEFVKVAQIKKGSRVTVTKCTSSYSYGWSDVWLADMRVFIGQTVTVIEISNSGIRLRNNDGVARYFPFFVLKPVKEKYKFKKKQLVLVRDHDDQLWVLGIFKALSNRHDKEEYPYGVYYANKNHTTFWAQCIPYEGNEHLLCTSLKK